MKSGKFLLLFLIWSITLTLFTVSATGGDRPMTGEETGYQSTEEVRTESGSPSVKISGCLSEKELAAIYQGQLENILEDIRVRAEEGKLIICGALVAKAEDLIKKYPALEEYKFILKLAEGSYTEAEVHMSWDESYSVSLGEIRVHGVAAPVKNTEKVNKRLTDEMNSRGKDITPFEIIRWEIKNGGLYYSAILPDTDSVTLLYPVI